MESRHFKWTGSLWPTTLCLPARPPRLIYLDLNHWIELSKAHSGHRDGKKHRCVLEVWPESHLPGFALRQTGLHRDGKKHRCVLDACLKAVRDGKAVFPLSEHIYAEIAKINSYRQRRDLREVIEQVCRYMVVTSLTVVVTHEIESVLDQTVGPSPVPLNTTNYLDWGVSRAFGRTCDIRIKSASGDDVTEEFRRTYPSGPEAFDTVLLNAERELSRRAIEGPTLQEEPGLRALGWSPEAIVQAHKQKASEELEQARRFDDYPNWRLGPIRDVITAREAFVEYGDIFDEGFARRGPGTMEQFFAVKPDDLRSIYSSMPSLDVAVTLKTSLHRNPNHKWTNNDIYDMRALALTIPYCDVVVTDRSMWSHVTRHKLPERYETVVLSQLAELPNHM